MEDQASKLYSNAVCLAPMVRSGTLPLRLLSLRYGATSVYSEEIIDKRTIATTRMENAALQTVDFVDNNNGVVFRTCQEEKDRIIYQIGTADAVLALKAAETVLKDVAAIDINMGCPKHFSIQGGMGAALLQKQETASDIIKTLRRNINLPVSCKIRILETTSKTIDFAKSMENSGAVAIGIHGRYTHERPIVDAHWDLIAPVPSALSIPVLANGDIYKHSDIDEVRLRTGCSSVLIARGALKNPSIFRSEGLLSTDEVVRDYLSIAADTGNVFQNTKYNVTRMLPSKETSSWVSSVLVPHIASAKTNSDMFKLWNLGDYLEKKEQEFAKFTKEDTGPKLNDENLVDNELYCKPCGKMMLSLKDMSIHITGRKHRNKLKSKPFLEEANPIKKAKS